MLQLTILPQLLAKSLTLTDYTKDYQAATNPGGYGGPNPPRSNILLIGVAGRQTAGQYRFAETVYADDQPSVLRFSLNTPGLYLCYVLAVSTIPPSWMSPVGTLWVDLQGVIKRKTSTTSLLGAEEFLLEEYTFEQLRELLPPLQAATEVLVPVLYTGELQRQIDEMLLQFVRRCAGNYPRGMQQLAEPWLHADATLAAIDVLIKQERYPEAAQHLAALQSIVGADSLHAAPLPQAGQTDWLKTQLS
jgi:hypothetical protein